MIAQGDNVTWYVNNNNYYGVVLNNSDSPVSEILVLYINGIEVSLKHTVQKTMLKKCN